MSRFEGLRTWNGSPQSPRRSNKFEGLRIQGVNETPQGDSWPRLIRNSIVDKGIGPALGLPNLLAQGLEGLVRGGAESKRRELEAAGLDTYDIETPEINALSSIVPTWEDIRSYTKDKTGVDFEARPTTAGQRVASEAIGVATPLGLLGLPGKATKAAKAMGAIKGTATGVAIGGTSGALQEGGVNPLAADLASSVIAPSMAAKLNPKNLFNNFKKIPETAAKVPLKLMGLSPKGLNIEAAQAARDLGIDLPAAALTNSTTTALLNQHIAKTPYFSVALKDKYKNADQQILEALNKIYDDVGPTRTPDITKKISDTYDRSKGFLGENASTMPGNLVKNTKEIKSGAVAQDADLKNLMSHKKTILQHYDPYNPSTRKKPSTLLLNTPVDIKFPVPKAPVQDLIDQKVAFNDIIWGKGEQLSGKFKTGIDHMRKGAMADLKEYGKENPKWLKEFEKADKLHGSVEKRTRLEELLNRAAINDATGEIKHNSLAKFLHNKKVIQIAKQELSPEIFTKLEKLGKVSRAFAISNKNTLNPSGTAFISTIINIAGGLATGSLGLPYIAGLGVAGATTSSLLTNKKFVDLALKYAEKPNLATSMQLNKYIKESTGYSAIALNKALQREQQDSLEGSDGL